eukprot:9985472-Ditylum_brightwellii.AAC.1
MAHPHDCAGTDGTMLFYGVDNSVDNSVDVARSKQNTCVDDNKEDVVDNNVDNNVDGGDKHLTHLTHAVDCCLKERSKQN